MNKVNRGILHQLREESIKYDGKVTREQFEEFWDNYIEERKARSRKISERSKHLKLLFRKNNIKDINDLPTELLVWVLNWVNCTDQPMGKYMANIISKQKEEYLPNE